LSITFDQIWLRWAPPSFSLLGARPWSLWLEGSKIQRTEKKGPEPRCSSFRPSSLPLFSRTRESGLSPILVWRSLTIRGHMAQWHQV
jgi:hypothetical protein